jgi:glycosyltransferase involved in cell wall biosynthesis
VYTGRLGWVGRSPEPLLDALLELKSAAPELARRIEVVFTGPLTEHERALVARPELDGMARSLGWVEHEDALRLQRAADSLLVLANGWSGPSVATGKLFEYLAAGRPILVVGDGTEAARIVGELRAGVVAPAEPRAIAGALRRLVEPAPGSPANVGPSAAAVERYSYARLAERMAELIESACA